MPLRFRGCRYVSAGDRASVIRRAGPYCGVPAYRTEEIAVSLIPYIQSRDDRTRNAAIATMLVVSVLLFDDAINAKDVTDPGAWFALLLFLGGVYIGQLILLKALSEAHEGWRRVALALGCFGGVIGGGSLLAVEGDFRRLSDFVELVLAAGSGAVLGLGAVVVGRWLYAGFRVGSGE